LELLQQFVLPSVESRQRNGEGNLKEEKVEAEDQRQVGHIEI
jgi:hypothetical protein